MTKLPEEISDAELDAAVGAAGQRVTPYNNFNFTVSMDTGTASLDGKLLTARDLRSEQTY